VVDLEVASVRAIYDDGKHNAFTDMCRFHGRLYLTFRSCPDSHMLHTSSRILVMSSLDGNDWSLVASFGVPDRDVRDPHLLVFRDRLHVYSGAWLVHTDDHERDIDEMTGHCIHTVDGAHWSEPVQLNGTDGHYIWRAATNGERAYLCARRKRVAGEPTQHGDRSAIAAALLSSSDGYRWREVGMLMESHGNETAFVIEENGDLIGVARGDGPGSRVPATLVRSSPPYSTWRRDPLNTDVGGPMIARWGSQYLVGGRSYAQPDSPRTALWWLEPDRLELAALLPSGGDTSYPGFVQLAPDHALLSYYSSHEGSRTHLAPSAIYLADLRLS